MIQILQDKITGLGLNKDFSFILAYVGFILGIFIVALVVDFIARRFILRGISKIITRSKTNWDDVALRKGIFDRLSHLAPAVVFYLSSPLLVSDEYAWTAGLAEFVRRAAMTYFIIILILVADAVLNTILGVYRDFEIAKSKPIRSYLQVAKILLFFIGGIIILSIVLNKSPWAFLTGLGAVAAVVMLVFKDSILGFVASVQNASYDTIRIGDWIEMPKYGADGDVIELSLNTMKVQNWDKTIVTVPMYALLSESVKNWRGMSESGGRRIKRHINIDINTICFCDEEMLNRYRKIAYISDYLEKKISEVQEHNQEKQMDTATLANGRHLTNIGTFRAYVEAYLKQHSKIHHGMTFLVRQLQPTAGGLPLEIYVFTNDVRWTHYEAIQADIFDHILAVAPLFDLQVFQNTSGQNYKIDIVSMPKGA